MPSGKKIETVSELSEYLKNSTGFLLTDYRGLTVSQITRLRRSLREIGAEYKVVKNSLFKLATQDMGEEGLAEMLAGPTAVAFVHQDAIAAAKALVDFMRVSKALELKGGLVDGHLYGAEQIQALSKIPPRDVLISQLLGGLQSPISSLVGTLQGIISEFVFTVQAVADQKAA